MAPPSAPLPGQRPAKSSSSNRNHASNKPYSRPSQHANGEQGGARDRKASTSTGTSSFAQHRAQPTEGLLSGLRSMLSAPLGWMGLSSKGSSSSRKTDRLSKAPPSSARTILPPPPPPPSAYRQSNNSMDIEQGNPSRYALPPPPASAFSSSAAQRYQPSGMSTSHSMPYLDAPVNGLPTFNPPRSSRPLPSSSTSRHLLTSSLSGVARSGSMVFPANGSAEPTGPSQRSERWMERYTRRDDQSPAPEDVSAWSSQV